MIDYKRKRQGKTEDKGRQEKERRQKTFVEFMHYCHKTLSRPLKVTTLSHSSSETIPPPRAALCPTRVRPYTDYLNQQQANYRSIYSHSKSTEKPPAHLFTPPIILEYLARRVAIQLISSEQDFQNYGRIAAAIAVLLYFVLVVVRRKKREADSHKGLKISLSALTTFVQLSVYIILNCEDRS